MKPSSKRRGPREEKTSRKRVRVADGGHLDQEDGEIAWLEHALGLDKSDGKSKLRAEFEQDGLEGTRRCGCCRQRGHARISPRGTLADLFEELEGLEAALDGSGDSSSDDASVVAGRPQESATGTSLRHRAGDRPQVQPEPDESLRRRVSGLLNRLAPVSLDRTLAALTELSPARSDRGLLGPCLVSALVDHIQNAGSGSDSLLVTYAALAVSVGRGALGDAVGAAWLSELLRVLVQRLDVIVHPQATEALLRFLGHLFVLGAIPCSLVLDACKHVLLRPTEQSLACLLATLKGALQITSLESR